MKRLKSKRGYTLVEIAVVTGLISLLTAIAVPNFMETRNSARRDTCINNLRQIQTAKEQYYIFEYVDDATVITNGADLDGYLRGGMAAVICPASGTYAFHDGMSNPTCDVTGHALPPVP